MKLYQLANDKETYGDKAGFWIVTTHNGEDELTKPVPTEAEAQALMNAMANTNCLEGMACPECKSLGPFDIEVLCWLEVHDDGTSDHTLAEWEDENRCECKDCGHGATVKNFKTKE